MNYRIDKVASFFLTDIFILLYSDCNLTIDITEKCLRLAQRSAYQLHTETSATKRIQKFFLLGSLNIDKEENKSLHVPTAVIPGDVIIPLSMQLACLGSEGVSPFSISEYYDAFQTLTKNLKLSCDSVDIKDMLSLKIHATYYVDSDEISINVTSGVVVPSALITAVPILPVSIVPTALARSLSGPLHLSNFQDTQKSGYVAINNSHNLLLVLDSDPKLSSIPLVGIWVDGVISIHHPYVWSACMRYLYSQRLTNKIRDGSTGFILVLYTQTRPKPEFWECSFSGKSDKFLYCQASDDIFMEKVAKTRNEYMRLQLVPNYMNSAFLRAKESFIMESNSGEKRDFIDSKSPEPRPTPTPYSRDIQNIKGLPDQEVANGLNELSLSVEDDTSCTSDSDDCIDQEVPGVIASEDDNVDKDLRNPAAAAQEESLSNTAAVVEINHLACDTDQTVKQSNSVVKDRNIESLKDDKLADDMSTKALNAGVGDELNETYETLAQTELKKLSALAHVRRAREQLAKEESEILAELRDIRNRKELIWTALTNGEERKAVPFGNGNESFNVEDDKSKSLPSMDSQGDGRLSNDSSIVQSDSDSDNRKVSINQGNAGEKLIEQSSNNSIIHHSLPSTKSDSLIAETERSQGSATIGQDSSIASASSKEESKLIVERTHEIQLHKITKEWKKFNTGKDGQWDKENSITSMSHLIPDMDRQDEVNVKKTVGKITDNRFLQGYSFDEFPDDDCESSSHESTNIGSSLVPSAERICEKYLKHFRPLQSLKYDNNMSFATVRYMEKHNLLTVNDKNLEKHKYHETPINVNEIPNSHRYRASITESIEIIDRSNNEDTLKSSKRSNMKVLDISRLKHLPKLM
ncbi:SCL-interrupting locus protein-like protein [Trichoplax sp. H2]|nr:SCL-interrupting locus protein-like protein [Trichoplax sp. H2]|eukprot:RDD43645.1 SCL-interrupting locus protein-like protein [Trichoplax sp. H2]